MPPCAVAGLKAHVHYVAYIGFKAHVDWKCPHKKTSKLLPVKHIPLPSKEKIIL